MHQVHLVIMNGRGTTDIENMVDAARRAATLDLIVKASACQSVDRIIISTSDPVLASAVPVQPDICVELDDHDIEFHFGRHLQSIIARHDIERLVYFGGGSAPLLSQKVLDDLASQVRDVDRLFVANNVYSVDFCAFTPANVLLSLEAPTRDNTLGWLLAGRGHLPYRELPRTAQTCLDIDTPIDLAVLSLHPDLPSHLSQYLDALVLDTHHIELAMQVFVARGAQVVLGGRISPQTIEYVGRETACRTRVFSEERGMQSRGRLAEVRSLLGMYIEQLGLDRFFAKALPELGDSAFIDDRVIWAHCHVWPSALDRFHSDLLEPKAISDPFIRHFTHAAKQCPIPVVLGGHSLVSGGLMVLVEAAWARNDQDSVHIVTGSERDKQG